MHTDRNSRQRGRWTNPPSGKSPGGTWQKTVLPAPASPASSEETRRDYVKQVKTIAEECKIALRNIRQDANNDIKKSELTEDEIKNGSDEVQELINKFNKIVDEKLKVKEQELMTV